MSRTNKPPARQSGTTSARTAHGEQWLATIARPMAASMARNGTGSLASSASAHRRARTRRRCTSTASVADVVWPSRSQPLVVYRETRSTVGRWVRRRMSTAAQPRCRTG